ncbi:MAG: PA domain-containing protein, partial [Candidatus Berkiella sp.]
MFKFKSSLFPTIVSLLLSGYILESSAAPNEIVLPSPASNSIMNRLQEVGRGSTINQTTFQIGDPTSTRNNSAGRLYKNYYYIPAASVPCQGEGALDVDAGVIVFKVKDPKHPERVATIHPPTGSGIGSIALYTTQNKDDILAVSLNGFCGANNATIGFVGPTKIEFYNVNDPSAPVKVGEIADVRDISNFYAIDNGLNHLLSGGLETFKQNNKHYLALTTNSPFASDPTGATLGSLQFYDVSDPANPTLAGWWGPENIPNSQKNNDNKYRDIMYSHLAPIDRPLMPGLSVNAIPGVDDSDFSLFVFTNPTRSDLGIISDAFGDEASIVRQATDLSIDKNGKTAYVGIFEGGVAILDISNLSDPKMIGLARDATSNDANRLVNVAAEAPVVSDNGKVLLHVVVDDTPFAASTTYNSVTYPAAVAVIGPPITATITDKVRFIGLACLTDSGCGTNTFCSAPIPAPNGASIALIRRGTCAFSVKAANALAAGYSAVIVMNRQGEGAGFPQGGSFVNIPNVMVSYDDGLAFLAPTFSAGHALVEADIGTVSVLPVSINTIKRKWGDLRIWDISNPKDPKLASIISTKCTDNPTDASCRLGGIPGRATIVKDLAFVPWSNEGLEVFDISNPYK